jgi:hypothetical protein
MVDAITPELLQAVPSTLGGFPVRIYQMEREVMLGDSMCGSGKKHGTGTVTKMKPDHKLASRQV